MPDAYLKVLEDAEAVAHSRVGSRLVLKPSDRPQGLEFPATAAETLAHSCIIRANELVLNGDIDIMELKGNKSSASN